MVCGSARIVNMNKEKWYGEKRYCVRGQAVLCMGISKSSYGNKQKSSYGYKQKVHMGFNKLHMGINKSCVCRIRYPWNHGCWLSDFIHANSALPLLAHINGPNLRWFGVSGSVLSSGVVPVGHVVEMRNRHFTFLRWRKKNFFLNFFFRFFVWKYLLSDCWRGILCKQRTECNNVHQRMTFFSKKSKKKKKLLRNISTVYTTLYTHLLLHIPVVCLPVVFPNALTKSRHLTRSSSVCSGAKKCSRQKARASSFYTRWVSDWWEEFFFF